MDKIINLNTHPASILTAPRGTICELDNTLFKLIYVPHLDKFCMVMLDAVTFKPVKGAVDKGAHSMHRYLVDAEKDCEFMNRAQLYEMVKL